MFLRSVIGNEGETEARRYPKREQKIIIDQKEATKTISVKNLGDEQDEFLFMLELVRSKEKIESKHR